MVRVVVIGIDGLDADLLRVYGPSLPNLRLLMLESPYLELQSCFPPDPGPSWASMYTGRNPAQHGILSTFARQNSTEQTGSSLSRMPEGKTFWERASQTGKRVCIVNPLFAYTESSLNGILHTFPAWDNREGWSGKKRHLARFCEALHTMTEQQTTAGLELLNSEPWDIFFIQFHALDAVQHLLWRYSDPGDPAYPGKNEQSGRIRNCYALFDSVIGRFRAEMEDDCVFLVVSGYGHGRGYINYLNLNEWLRAEGLLVTRPRYRQLLHAPRFNVRAKQHSISLLTHQDMYPPHISNTFAHESIVSQQNVDRTIDQQATQAQVAMVPQSSTFGGISLNEAAISASGATGAYEQVRNSIVQRLLHMRLQGRPVVHWAKVREDMYTGPYVDRYPNILFELRNEYGISAAVHVPLTTNNPLHTIVSGTHRMQGVLLLGNLPAGMHIREIGAEPTVMDVAPTILALLGETTSDADNDGSQHGRALVNTILLLRRSL